MDELIRTCAKRECGNCERLNNGIQSEEDCRTDLMLGITDILNHLAADAASYQQIKKTLSDEGFSDLTTMISRYKQVMAEANEIEIAKDEELATKTALLDATIAGQETLQKALAASQRRERAAVEDIYRIASCDACKHYDADENACANPSAESHECFEWRGEAGRREADDA